MIQASEHEELVSQIEAIIYGIVGNIASRSNIRSHFF